MIQILSDLFSKLVKKSPSSEEEPVEEFVDVAAYFNIAVNKEGELVISSDYLDGYEEHMSKLVFMLCSGSLMETIGEIIAERCGDDEKARDKILSEAYNLLLARVSDLMEDDEDDEEPVVDPCYVFRPKMEEGEDEEE